MNMDHFGHLTLLWPRMLWLYVLVPVLVLLYLRLLARRRRVAASYPSLDLLGQSVGDSRLRRHLPALILLLGLCAMLFAVARPQAVVKLPSRLETVVLAMDMSGSMRADDVKPSRMVASQTAAKAFIDDQPHNVRLGIVAVAGAAALVQSPTRLREDATAAIDNLQIQRGTALGSGLIISLATLLPAADLDVEGLISGRPTYGAVPPKVDPEAPPVTPGSNRSVAIVLLSDGQSNTGPDPMKIVDVAASHGVRIYTVGVGTNEGATLSVDGWSMRVRLDDEALKKIASGSGGEYFRADNAKELKKIYQSLAMRLAYDKEEPMEISALFVALGAMLTMAAALLSMWWFGRVL
jgi:Ca-activated chloride channel family protein